MTFSIGERVRVSPSSETLPGQSGMIDCNPALHNRQSHYGRPNWPYSSCEQHLRSHMVRNDAGTREPVLIEHLEKL